MVRRDRATMDQISFVSWAVIFVAVCLHVSQVNGSVASVGCKGFNNKAVDWFIIYKLPHHTSVAGTEFYYMDNESSSLRFSPFHIDTKQQPLYYTLQSIYGNTTKGSFMYMMYNDEKPNTHSASESYGHTKGVVAFDTLSGFWLVHSTPKFPSYRHSGYVWPENGHYYGQTFLCVTYPYKEMNKIGKQLKYNYPQIYDSYFSPSMEQDNPVMASVVLHHARVSNPPWNRTQLLISKGGNKFISFAKYSKFDGDLYSAWLAPVLSSNLLVESWQNGRGKLKSFCSGKYHVYNIRNIRLHMYSFKQTRDHSKWAITAQEAKKNIVCIGDINRQEHQKLRAGGTVCFKNPKVWTAFYNAVTSYEKCPKLRVSS